MTVVVLAWAAGAGAQVQIELRNAVTLPAGEIRLASVAGVASGDAALTERAGAVSLGVTPWPGNARVITRDQVVMHLVRAGVDITQLRWQGPETCAVAVQTTRVTGEQIVQAAREYLSSLPALKRDDVKMAVDQTPRDQLLAGNDKFVTLSAMVASMDRPWGKVRVLVRISLDDKVIATVPVMFQITCRQKVLFLTQSVNKGDAIDPSKLEVREVIVGAANESDQYLENFADVAGKKAARPLASGLPLTGAMVTEPHAIRRGENVSIVLRSDHMEVLTKGVAQRDGFVGDVVPIKVVLSGKDVTCKVLASGAVELPL